jgi:transposase
VSGYVIGIDVGKSAFHLVAMDQAGNIVEKKKFSRAQLLNHLANVSTNVLAMEACSGAHCLAKALSEQGHTVKLIPPQYVRPYVKTNKNDFVDAEAIAEAVQRPTMRFVPVKTDAQLDLQALHRARQRWIGRRTSLINQIRAFLLERGVAVRTGPSYLRHRMLGILANQDDSLSATLLSILRELWQEWMQIDERVARTDEQIQALASENDACRRLQTIPGIGIVTATALVAAVGNGSAFRKGRDLAAWLGLVPRQYSTGGRPKLLGISKRGNSYLRQLFVHGARAVFARLKREQHHMGKWLEQLGSRKKPSIVIVAMANKLARIAWAVLAGGQAYRATALPDSA